MTQDVTSSAAADARSLFPAGMPESRADGRPSESPIVELVRVTKRFGTTRAVDDLSLSLLPGKTLGMVGESGCGKSTVARLVVGLERPTSGELRYEGRPYPRRDRGLRAVRRHVGMVFQDPYEALDPRCTLRQIVGEPLMAHGLWRDGGLQRVRELLDAVGLPKAALDSRPGHYSGGGRQRIGIARALALDPSLVVCDEPTSALDVSIQAQIINLLLQLQAERGLAYLFISHDLDVVRRVSDEVVVIYAGAIMESGLTTSITASPQHPYTRALLSGVTGTTPEERKLSSRVRLNEERRVPSGACPFAGRCPEVHRACARRPPLVAVGDRLLACHLVKRTGDQR
ncbi:MAG: oligopeptide/dipeptide ABC transporter ATP-binding protein [Acidimicrobiales bacterium]